MVLSRKYLEKLLTVHIPGLGLVVLLLVITLLVFWDKVFCSSPSAYP
jgi:hypothetical protein